MTASHNHFEYLCGLAATEELTELETVALRRHAHDCAACRTRILETTQLTSHLLLTHALHQRNGELPQDMRERFVIKAIAEGVPLKRESGSGTGKLGLAAAVLAALLVAMLTLNRNHSATEATSHLQPASGVYASAASTPYAPHKRLLARRHPKPMRQPSPVTLAAFQQRDFPVPRNLSMNAPAHLTFPSLAPHRDNGLNLMANFQPEAESRTFVYSGSYVPRLLPACRCEPR